MKKVLVGILLGILAGVLLGSLYQFLKKPSIDPLVNNSQESFEEELSEWALESNEYTLISAQEDFWKSAPGKTFQVCMKDDPTRCTHLVEYDGFMKGYVLAHYKHMFEGDSYQPTAEELEEFQLHSPAITRSFDAKGRQWSFATWGNEFVGGAFMETSEKTLIIYEDAGSGMGFSGEDVEKLAKTIKVE